MTGGRNERLRLRDWAVAAAVTLIVAAGAGLFFQPRLAGISIDLDFWLRHHLMPFARTTADPAVLVVAIDEETYLTEPFKGLPNAVWTHEIAGVLDALVAADVKVVGFDAIFPTSIDTLLPGFDRDFLLALHNAARAGKVVLGESQNQRYPLHPFASQSFAVGNERNIRSLNLFTDDDEIIRRVSLTFEPKNAAADKAEPSMALELAMRATASAPTPLADGGMALAGYAIPGSAENTMLLDFPDGEVAPTYSLADLHACVEGNHPEFFKQHFAGKVVLLGEVLDVEDRKLTSSRLITAPEHASSGARCALTPRDDLFRRDLVHATIPGVYIFATAVANLLEHAALREAAPMTVWALLLAAAGGATLLTMRVPPWLAGASLLGGAILWAVAVTASFRAGLVLPLLAPPLAAGLTMALLLGYRIAVTDRARRFLRSSFALYLDGALVDRMLASDRLPELGGEEREITVLVSDVAGFTALSERLAPAELVRVMNRYLTEMTEAIESQGGFVDKYVGDAIIAIFGAPLDEPRHALRATCAALRCRDRLAALDDEPGAFGGHRLAARIGLSTGVALVGNIGSRRRFNYTALGDTVNLAARLEGANKVYDTDILASAATRAAAGDAILWREIDRVRVLGRDEPVTLFEPRALASEAGTATPEGVADFANALAEYRAGRFAVALRMFETLGPSDRPAQIFAARARRLAANPPATSWDGVEHLDQK